MNKILHTNTHTQDYCKKKNTHTKKKNKKKKYKIKFIYVYNEALRYVNIINYVVTKEYIYIYMKYKMRKEANKYLSYSLQLNLIN